MDQGDQLLNLIHSVYAAPGSPEGWQSFLGQLSAALNPSATIGNSYDPESRREEFQEEPPTPGRQDSDLVEMLIPHVRRALDIHRRLLTAQAMSSDLAVVVNRASAPVLFVDADGRVTFMNRAAETRTRRGATFVLDRGGLKSTQPSVIGALRRLLSQPVATSIDQLGRSGGPFAPRRSSARRSLIVRVVPITRRFAWVTSVDRPVAMVLAADPERTPVPDEDNIRRFLGLTPAEARLTRLLAQGMKLAEAAARLGWAVETARTRVKSVFEKTKTHRQVELVRLVLQVPVLEQQPVR